MYEFAKDAGSQPRNRSMKRHIQRSHANARTKSSRKTADPGQARAWENLCLVPMRLVFKPAFL